MSNIYAIYVPQSGLANLEVGLSALTWGWRDSVLELADHRSVVDSIQVGDLLLFGSGGPNPRVPSGEWSSAVLGRVIVMRAAGDRYRTAVPLWSGDLFPERVGLETLTELTSVDRSTFGTELLEGMRLSATKQGIPIRLNESLDPSATVFGAAPGDASLDVDGDLNGLALTLVRKEQGRLRKAKFGGALEIKCSLCGRTLPARVVRAAHIKPRAKCTPSEMRDLDNVMGACALGCDELFEHGFVGIDDTMKIISAQTLSGDIESVASSLAGRAADLPPGSLKFVQWHRTSHGIAAGSGGSSV